MGVKVARKQAAQNSGIACQANGHATLQRMPHAYPQLGAHILGMTVLTWQCN